MEIPKYIYFRVRVINKGTGVEVEDASDVDVVEVVRCKDCIYFYEVGNDGWGRCYENGGRWQRDDYCSWGKMDEVKEWEG